MPYWDRIPRLDRREPLQGVLNNSMTFWTLTQHDATIDMVVLADTAFGSDEGLVLLAGNVGGVLVFVNGDYTAGCAVVGRTYDATLELSEVFPRDEQGRAIVDGDLQLRNMTIAHRNTGRYKLKVDHDSGNITNRVDEFDASGNDIQEDGRKQVFIGSSSKKVTLKVESDFPQPVTISTINLEGDYSDS